MKFSVTIPQLFYDLIARVIPGFLFLLILRIQLHGTGLETMFLAATNPGNAIDSLINGMSYLIICYLIGSCLTAFVFFSFNEATQEKHEKELKDKGLQFSLSEMYHSIRIQNESEGFRIIKLRAEARMLERSRTAMSILVFLPIFLFLIGKSSIVEMSEVSMFAWVVKLIVPLILLYSFRKSEESSWNRYYGNILKCYNLVEKYAAIKKVAN